MTPSNRQRVISETRHAMQHSAMFCEEIEYYMDTYSDDPDYNEADALDDCLNFAESNDERRLARICIDVLIRAGYYEARDCATVIMGRDRSPVRKGVRYDCVDAWSVWINR